MKRRTLFQLATAAAALRRGVAARQAPQPQQRRFALGAGSNPEPFPVREQRAAVAIAHGDQRRANVYNALKAIDKDLREKMKGKRYAIIKPNFVNTENQLASSHADAMRGILDYLSESFAGPVVIAESSAGDTRQAFENFRYNRLPPEYRKQQLKLIDLNEEAKFERIALLDGDLHIVPCRLAARLLDPEAFVISAGILKTHNTVIASLGIKNMALGAPLHQPDGQTPYWNEKRKYHVGLRQTHYNIMVTAQRLSWGATLIDGYEGMEGNGPNSGTPVPSRIALASTDIVAVDRVAGEAMGVNPEWLGYVKYCGAIGIGQFEPSKIDVIGARLADVKRSYRMHPEIDRELKWQGPMTELPFNMGWVRPPSRTHEG
ncbi:MAG TPA: DUF362 domain-containing protein [Verrucomicrobiae bacterium]|nr:DUF362 domain-containing protein [Verrucomicrobiae bacterium]